MDIGLISSILPGEIVLGMGITVSIFQTAGQDSFTKETFMISVNGIDNSFAIERTKCFGISPSTRLFGILQVLSLFSTWALVTNRVKLGPVAMDGGISLFSNQLFWLVICRKWSDSSSAITWGL